MSSNQSKIIITGEDQTRSAFQSVIKNVDEINSKVGGLKNSFSSLGSVITSLGAGAAITGLVASFGSVIKSAIDLADEFDNLKARTGIAVESLGGYKFLAEQTDLSLETLAKGIRKVSQLTLDASRGNEVASESFRNLGLNVERLSKLTPEQQFREYFKALRNINEEQRALAINDTLGPKFVELATLAAVTTEEYDGLIKKGKELYNITSEQATAAANFNDQIDILKASVSSLGIAIGGPLVESLNLSIARMKEASSVGKNFLQVLGVGITGAFETPIQTGPELSKKESAALKERISVLSDLMAEERASIGLSKDSDRAVENRIKKYDEEKRTLLANLQVHERYLQDLKKEESKEPLKSFTGGNGGKPPKGGGSGSGKSDATRELERQQSEARRALEATFDPLEKFNDELRKQFDLYSKGFHTTDEYAKIVGHLSSKYYESSDSAKQFKKDQEEAKKAIESSLNPVEKFQSDLTRLNQLYVSGQFNLEEYRKVVGKLSTDFNDISTNGKKSFDRLQEYAISASRNIQSALSDSIFNFISGQGNPFENLKNTFLRIQSEKISLSLFDAFDKNFSKLETGKSVGQTAADAFTSGVKNGNFFTFIKDAFSRVFSFGGSTGSAASTISGIGSTASIGSSSLFSSIGTGLGSLATGLAAAAGPIAALMAATSVLKGLAGDKRLGGGFGKALNTIGDIPIIGDLIPVIPLINGLFGRGPYKLKQRNFQGEIEADANVESQIWDSFKSKGGLFAKNKWKGIGNETSEEIEAEFSKTISTFKKGISNIADVLDLNAEAARNFKTKFDIIIDHKDEEKAKKQIEDLFNSFGDTMTSMVMPTVDEFKNKGETLFEAFQRLGKNFISLVDATVILGKSLQEGRDLIKAFGHENSEALIKNFESLDEFTQLIQFYEQNFLDANDILKRKQEQLSDSLVKLGLSSSLSREEFKKLIESVDDVGGISQELFVKLIKLSPLFDEVADGVDTLGESLSGVTKTLDQLKSDVREAFDRRANELNGVKEQFKGILENLKQFKQSLNQGSLSPLTPQQKLDDARLNLNRTLLAARNGNADAISDFPRVAEEFLQASQVFNASSAAYQSDFNLIKNLTDEMENLSKNQISDVDKQLSKLDSQVSQLIDLNKNVQSVEDAIIALKTAISSGKGNSNISDDQIRAIANDNSLTTEQKIAWADKNGLSNAQIIKAVPGVTNDQLNQLRGGSSVTDGQIRKFIEKNVNDPMAIYRAAVANGVSRFRLAEVANIPLSEIEDWVRKNNLAMFERGTDYVPKTGISLIHKGEAIIPSNAMSIFKELIQEIRELRREQMGQTGDLISSSVESNIQNAESIINSITKSVMNTAYYQRSYKVAGIR